MLRAWRNWYREELEAALAGLHGAVIAELMGTRLTVLHEVNSTITRLRERNGLAPIDDPLPSERENVFG